MNKKILFALILMGFTSLVVQTLLIREFLISFYGNELTIGLILANWIILEALGSSLSNRRSLSSKNPYLVYALLQTGIALYLPLSIFFIRTIKNIWGLTLGEGIAILPIFLSSFLILAPLSFFDGAQFPFGCRMLSDTRVKPLESAGKVYILEAMGFILAGPLFTYLLIAKLNAFSIAFCLGALNLFCAILLLKDKLNNLLTKSLFIIINILFILAAITFFGPAAKLQKMSINKQWRNQEVLSYENSVYANLVVTKTNSQYTFYSDGIPIVTTPVPNITYIEELVHFTMLSHPNPKNILLLSGGAGGVIKEVLKYPVDKITYAELDPLLIKLLKDFPTALTQEELEDRRLDIQYIDCRRFLRLTKSRYDIIILNLPMPSTLQLNRFYTQEFFGNIKSVLTPNGIFSFSLPGSLSYINQPLRDLNGSILNTLEDIFYINIIPGDSNLYLASKSAFKISPEIFLRRLQGNNIQSRLLTRPHLEYRLNPNWLEWFNDSLSGYKQTRKNLDLLPTATFYSISYWNTIFSSGLQGFFGTLAKLNFKILLFVLLLFGLGLFILMGIFPKLKRASIGFAVGTTGFVGLSFDLILIYAYQSLYGFVFHHLALLITAFMAGLTLGGWLMTKKLTKIKNDLSYFLKIELMIVGFCLMVGPILLCLNRFSSVEFSFVFFFLSCVSGYLVGSEFPLANKIYQNKIGAKAAGILYALDLAGAWLAALIISIALIPVIGIIKTCLLLAVLKIISSILVGFYKD
ncbi:MAG: fused MFS/spermidine synthase [Candidatus Omnitrophica bacterium]|nr:fused MFS/spermidine synthase [Candidatus Omnitrophota bacterium]